MGTVVSSPFAQATAFGNQRKIDRCQDGTLFATVANNQGAATYEAYSKDNGATWTGSGGIPDPGGSGTTYASNPTAFTDDLDYRHVAFKSPSNGYLYYVRGTPNAARTAYTWSTATQLTGNQVNYDFPDVVAFRDPANAGAWVVFAVSSYASPSSAFNYPAWAKLTISSAGVITLTDNFSGNPLASNYGVQSGHVYPSIDFNHTGDGKTVAGGTPHLYVGWSAAKAGAGFGIRFRKATYSSGSWTWGTEREIDNTIYAVATLPTQFFFDGSRCVFTGEYATSGQEKIVLHDRDAADPASGGTTLRTLNAAIVNTDIIACGASTYDSAGNVYLFGRDAVGGNGTHNLKAWKWTRSTTTLALSATIESTAPDQPYVSVRRGPQGQAIDYVYTDGTASPYTVTSGRITLNTAPNAATPAAPTTGSNANRTDPIVAQWAFNDPDAGDSQSRADIRSRVVANPVAAWTTVTNAATTATNYTWAANTFTAGQQVEWQVLTYDAQGVVAGGAGTEAWSASSFFTAVNPPTVSITDPSIDGAGVATQAYPIKWSASAQDAYQVMRAADSGGVVSATVYSDTGTVEDSTSRARTLNFDTNARTEHILVRVRYQGIWSAWADRRVVVSYTAPPTPVAVLTPDNENALMLVAITNPTPSGSQPAVTGVNVLVDDGFGEGLTQRVTGWAPNSTWPYHLPVSGFDYVNRIKVVAVGANGTTSEALAT